MPPWTATATVDGRGADDVRPKHASRRFGSPGHTCRRSMRACWVLGACPAVLSTALILAMLTMAHAQNMPASPQTLTDAQSGPVSNVAVYWVGHSLMESKTASDWGQVDLMSMVGLFAKARNLDYRMGEHTLWGTPLSGQWRGRPHSYARDASAMVPKREAFERTAATYDTLVLTETIPLARTVDHEFSAFYLRRFYCTLKTANPGARVFLYQSWINLQGGDGGSGFPPPHQFDWRTEMAKERVAWHALADAAARRSVRTPGASRWLDKLGWPSSGDAGCQVDDPIQIVPVGDTLVLLADRLAKPRPGDHFSRPDGSVLRLADLFANPYVDWPAHWPVAAGVSAGDSMAEVARLKRRDPAKPHDDIHPSLDGIYVGALVHFAALYRQSPLGLPHPAKMGERLARTLQCIAWETVAKEPRAGVGGKGDCPP
jgi:hypothetical protein